MFVDRQRGGIGGGQGVGESQRLGGTAGFHARADGGVARQADRIDDRAVAAGGSDRAARHGERARAAQRGRAAQSERAGIEGGATGVGVVAGEDEHASARRVGHGQAAAVARQPRSVGDVLSVGVDAV